MSSNPELARLALGDDEAAQLGEDDATRIRISRLIVVVAQELRTLMDQRLRPDGLTTQQAALINIVDASGAPSISQAAAILGTTHQNIKQIADALGRKGFLRTDPDKRDARIRRLTTTAKSRRTWKRRSQTDQQAVLDWFASLDRDEAQTLFRLLLRLETGLRTALAVSP